MWGLTHSWDDLLGCRGDLDFGMKQTSGWVGIKGFLRRPRIKGFLRGPRRSKKHNKDALKAALAVRLTCQLSRSGRRRPHFSDTRHQMWPDGQMIVISRFCI